ncbi:hypothetical protein PV328_000403 [Microctonus aethiopoides]|uniref:phospholipase A1 n=1 Tax=Microctonus aethiopoides TaxID=144406 RepID=A0AA39FUU4_9HYME|nr:hypothetical protein PV328_000403 [Microctonus aethiopoides]
MIRDAYLKFADCNVILVDWNNAAYRIYTTSYASIERIGNRVAQMINWLIKKNLIDITDLHIIGFSLGAHVAGFTGKALAPLKVRRITGLDPAAPGFEWSPADRRLDESDAEFVDVIHTETRFAGTWQPIGHADFYPNWGHDQKGCIFMDLPCSHQMANKFYAEEGNTFMGHGANPRVHGVFYVDNTNLDQTNQPYGSCSECQPVVLERDVQFHLYTRNNPMLPQKLQINNENSLINSNFNSKHNTIILIHGFTESASMSFAKTISTEYLKRDDYNVIRVDWKKLAAGPLHYYSIASDNVPLVGKQTSKLIKWLKTKKKISISKLHIIGFSLGAHVAGFVGKEFSSHKIGRISGLDPAGPGFHQVDQNKRLDKSDAHFVDIIHTDPDAAGLRLPIGHADFYPNQGLLQPGCIHEDAKFVCSHRRAWKYYAESISSEYGFPALKCQTWEPTVNNCTRNPEAFMGFAVSPLTRGIFLLYTNSRSPFARSFADCPGFNIKPDKA